eukprot:scaffold198251_cov27-Prasinocladus_malaysianus.AAC.1
MGADGKGRQAQGRGVSIYPEQSDTGVDSELVDEVVADALVVGGHLTDGGDGWDDAGVERPVRAVRAQHDAPHQQLG